VALPPAAAPPAPTAPAPPATMRAAAPAASARPGISRAAPRPPATAAGRLALTIAERLTALEQCLLGDGAPPQGEAKGEAKGEAPFQRLAWLEAQLGGASGTVLQRLDALEHTAKAQGLL
jgi:hypothetical protein